MSMPFVLFGSGVRLGVVAGIPVTLSWSFFPIAAIMALSQASWYASGLLGLPFGVLSVGLLFGSVLLHEFGHALMARRFGIQTEAITLHFLGGVAKIASEPRTPRQEALVALAGPAVSLALGAVFTLLAFLLSLVPSPWIIRQLIETVALTNIVLGVFNLIPGLPLDGGRVLRAWLWNRNGNRDVATARAARVGEGFGYALMALGFLGLLSGAPMAFVTILLGWFVTSIAKKERRRAEWLLSGMPMPNPGVFPFMDIRSFVLRHQRRPPDDPAHHRAPIRDAEFVVRYPDGREFTGGPHRDP